MGVVLHRGRAVRFDEEGTGPAVLFLHAFPMNASMWNGQRAALRARFRTVALDYPGFGESALLGEAASMDLFAQAALAVLDALAIPRAGVVGLSMGGYVCFELLARAPERVAALALCDTRAGADSEQGRKNREDNARAVEREGSGALIERMLPNLLSPGAGQEVRNEVERLIRSAPPQGAAAALRAMGARKDSSSRLSALACPCITLAGAEDILTPPSEAKAMAQAIPGAEYREIPSAGHLSNFEQPEAFNSALLSFFEKALLHRTS